MPESASERSSQRVGVACGLGAYLWWGCVVVYFKLLSYVMPLEVLAHRVVWSVLLLAVITGLLGAWGQVRSAMCSGKVAMGLVAASLMLATNWGVFIYAVQSGKVLHASLGYFINPLVTVLLAVIFLGERLRAMQVVALGLACVGVAVFAVDVGTLPWIGLTLAVSFGFYGLIRKTVKVAPVPGLLVETAVLLPVAGAFVLMQGQRHDAASWGLLAASGVVTTVPLLLFVEATRRLKLATVGFMQYVAPSMQFLMGVWYGEQLRASQWVMFACIWTGLAIFTLDTARLLLAERSRAKADGPAAPSPLPAAATPVDPG